MTKRRNIRPAAIKKLGLTCAHCGADCSTPAETGWVTKRKDSATADHVIPLAIGGDDDLANIQILCPECNREKTSADLKMIAKCRRKRRKHDKHKARMRVKLGGNDERA